MIDPNDCDYFSWAPESHEFLKDTYKKYSFLNTIPLNVKRGAFRNMNNTLSDYVLSDLFKNLEQMRWAINNIKFGMQLPVQDVDMISDAFKQYSDLLFILHRMSREETYSENDIIEITNSSMLELVCRQSTLFNPRLFFEDELPLCTLNHQFSDQPTLTRESCLLPAKQLPLTPKVEPEPEPGPSKSISKLEVPNGNIQRRGSVADTILASRLQAADGFLSNIPEQSFPKSPMPMSFIPPRSSTDNEPPGSKHKHTTERISRRRTNTLSNISPMATATSNPKTRSVGSANLLISHARHIRTMELWERYVSLLSRVLKVYSTIMRLLQPDVSSDIAYNITRYMMLVADIVLSQGGKNPRLKVWVNKYKLHFNADIWDKTWGTIGERLEYDAVKLAIDVWSRVIAMPNVSNDVVLFDFENWLHRDRVLDCWLQITKQVSNRVLHAYYPYDKTVGTDTIHVRFLDFSVAGKTNDEDAILLLRTYAQTSMDLDSASSHAFYLYSNNITAMVKLGLYIKRIVEIDGAKYVQDSPTANYALHLFGKPLFEIAKHIGKVTPYYIEARCRVIALFSQILVLAEDPKDPLRTWYRNSIISILDNEINNLSHVQAVLPNVPMLLKSSRYVRPFIAPLFGMVCRVLPWVNDVPLVQSEISLRYLGYNALSALISFVGYYHEIGCSDLIADTDNMAQNQFTKNVAQDKNNPNLHYNQFKESALEDSVFMSYLHLIFQVLLSSAIGEKDFFNLQCLTCVTLVYLYQYAEHNSGYAVLFIELYVELLRNTRDDKLATVYIYGLTQVATITWKNVLSEEQHRSILVALFHGLSNCDHDLKRFTHWDRYHQIFITSIRCLSVWMSVSAEQALMLPELLDETTELLKRCNMFLSTADSPMYSIHGPLERRVNLGTSVEYNEHMYQPGSWAGFLNISRQPYTQKDTSENIVSYTTLDSFSKSDPPPSQRISNTSKNHTVRVLTDSLHKVLTATISVFSTILLRIINRDQYNGSYAPHDTLLVHSVLQQKKVPDNSVIFSAFDTKLNRLMRDFTPVSVTFFSAYHSMIYSIVNFKQFSNGKWSDSASLHTSRYSSGSKQWIVFTSKPKAMAELDPGPEIYPDVPTTGELPYMPTLETAYASNTDVQPWVRIADGLLGSNPLRSTFGAADKLQGIHRTTPLISDEGEEKMEQRTAGDFDKLHNLRIEPDIEFTPVQPCEQLHRGNNHYRRNLHLRHSVDSSLLEISEPMLQDLDHLDNLDNPFTAYAGVIYMRSANSLATECTLAKGPLKGVSPEFNNFLMTLNRVPLPPVERLKTHPRDPTIMRCSFSIRSFEVIFDLAPNVSSLISGCKMGAHDNDWFYDMMHERGIYVMWFDSHMGNIDMDLAWQFVDDRDNFGSKQRANTSNSVKSHSERNRASHDRHPHHSDKKENTRFKPSLPVSNETIQSAPTHVEPVSETSGKDFSSIQSLKPEKVEKKRDFLAEPIQNKSKSKAREFFQKAIHITRRQASSQKSPLPSRENSEPCSNPCSEQSSMSIHVNDQQHDSKLNSHYAQSPPCADPVFRNKNTPETPVSAFSTNSSIAKMHMDKFSMRGVVSTPTSPLMHSPKSINTGPNVETGRDGNFPESMPVESMADTSVPKMRVLIAVAPVDHTCGHLVKVSMSASGGSKQMNDEFIRMTGPLMSSTIVETKQLAALLSTTVTDASANIASLNCDDFSVVNRRMGMITSIIENYCVKHKTVDDLHKYLFSVGKSGVQSTFAIPHTTTDVIAKNDGNADAINHQK
ncbi:hypothetical protein BX661DRAFT_225267 [Kickxella alabastrina]|uniref:uncharacterized protein n=1 Tax=Kickxella alabastrina TaxID=61397 RepID=UPI002221042B|nr:uncharacterized protein BX661DRAFT_225267 [Kickxella alabastrina]KAI7825863.1 hypothetical protein BX661DRAFT_225267 [Kickxella alabastrina]